MSHGFALLGSAHWGPPPAQVVLDIKINVLKCSSFFEADFTIRKWKSFPKRGRGVGVIWAILQTFSTLFFAIEFCGYETDLASGGTLKQDNYPFIDQKSVLARL